MISNNPTMVAWVTIRPCIRIWVLEDGISINFKFIEMKMCDVNVGSMDRVNTTIHDKLNLFINKYMLNVFLGLNSLKWWQSIRLFPFKILFHQILCLVVQLFRYELSLSIALDIVCLEYFCKLLCFPPPLSIISWSSYDLVSSILFRNLNQTKLYVIFDKWNDKDIVFKRFWKSSKQTKNHVY